MFSFSSKRNTNDSRTDRTAVQEHKHGHPRQPTIPMRTNAAVAVSVTYTWVEDVVIR
ncbi:MAG: hypothetical protein IPN89_17515 [Saprospiraceae bacterium]|nr:hypothetical protein [Saprospiraceae bacterium]